MDYLYKAKNNRQKVYNTGGYDDSESRNMTIPFALEVLKLVVEPTPPNKKMIDLVCVNDPNIGIEIEHSEKWIGNYWNKTNSGLYTVSKMGYPTVNLPWWRKYQYWTESLNSGWNKNIFIRWNCDYTCAIVVKPETILNRKKSIDARFRTYNITTGGLEDWKVFKREDVETYNLTENKYVLDDSYKKSM